MPAASTGVSKSGGPRNRPEKSQAAGPKRPKGLETKPEDPEAAPASERAQLKSQAESGRALRRPEKSPAGGPKKPKGLESVPDGPKAAPASERAHLRGQAESGRALRRPEKGQAAGPKNAKVLDTEPDGPKAASAPKAALSKAQAFAEQKARTASFAEQKARTASLKELVDCEQQEIDQLRADHEQWRTMISDLEGLLATKEEEEEEARAACAVDADEDSIGEPAEPVVPTPEPALSSMQAEEGMPHGHLKRIFGCVCRRRGGRLHLQYSDSDGRTHRLEVKNGKLWHKVENGSMSQVDRLSIRRCASGAEIREETLGTAALNDEQLRTIEILSREGSCILDEVDDTGGDQVAPSAAAVADGGAAQGNEHGAPSQLEEF